MIDIFVVNNRGLQAIYLNLIECNTWLANLKFQFIMCGLEILQHCAMLDWYWAKLVGRYNKNVCTMFSNIVKVWNRAMCFEVITLNDWKNIVFDCSDWKFTMLLTVRDNIAQSKSISNDTISLFNTVNQISLQKYPLSQTRKKTILNNTLTQSAIYYALCTKLRAQGTNKTLTYPKNIYTTKA